MDKPSEWQVGRRVVDAFLTAMYPDTAGFCSLWPGPMATVRRRRLGGRAGVVSRRPPRPDNLGQGVPRPAPAAILRFSALRPPPSRRS